MRLTQYSGTLQMEMHFWIGFSRLHPRQIRRLSIAFHGDRLSRLLTDTDNDYDTDYDYHADVMSVLMVMMVIMMMIMMHDDDDDAVDGNGR